MEKTLGQRLHVVLDKQRSKDIMEKFEKSDVGQEFWDLLIDTVESNDSIPFLLKLKHQIDELIEDEMMFRLANAVETVSPE